MAKRSMVRPGAEKFVAVTRGFAYPCGADLAAVREAGGFSSLPEDMRAKIRFKTVRPGEDCSDMPAESLAHYLERGDVARVEAAEE